MDAGDTHAADATSDAPSADTPQDAQAAESTPDGVGADAASDPLSASRGCVPTGELTGGPANLVDLFLTDQGFLVVRDDAILLIGRDRVVKKTVVLNRLVTSAAFDGHWLALADQARLDVYSASLDFQGGVNLQDLCPASVITPDGVFVCGTNGYPSGVFSTFNLAGPTLLNRSTIALPPEFGSELRTIPGGHDFIAAEHAALKLYRVDSAGAVGFVGESQSNINVTINSALAFLGTPITHVLTSAGDLRTMSAASGCVPNGAPINQNCFRVDGNIGTLAPGQRFAGLATDSTGALYALAGPVLPYGDPPCRQGCALQQIDVTNRTIVAQKPYVLSGTRLKLVPDPACKMVAVGYSLSPGHRIDLLDYGTSAGDGGIPESPPSYDAGATTDAEPDVSPAPDAGADGPAENGSCSDRPLWNGADNLVNVHVLPSGILVVSGYQLTLYDRSGAVSQTIPAGREFLTSTWDKELVVSDALMATVYDANLQPQRTFPLTESCRNSTTIDGLGWMCSYPSNMGNLRLYNTATGAATAAGGVSGQPGPVRSIPGRPLFLFDGNAYGFGADGKATLASKLNLFSGSAGFLGRPATHMVDQGGTILRIVPDSCPPSATGSGGGCVAKEGMVGTLRNAETVVAMTDDEKRLYLAVRRDNSGTFDAPCTEGCTLQQIDVENRVVATQRRYARSNALILSVVHDPICQKLLVGYRINPAGANPRQFGVDLASYQ